MTCREERSERWWGLRGRLVNGYASYRNIYKNERVNVWGKENSLIKFVRTSGGPTGSIKLRCRVRSTQPNNLT